MFVAEVQQIFSAFKFISNNFLREKYMSKINKEKLNLKQKSMKPKHDCNF